MNLEITSIQSQGYERLVKSLPSDEKRALQIDMDYCYCNETELETLAQKINDGVKVLSNDTNEARKIVVIALKALKMNLISLQQVASLHILDAAIRNFITHPVVLMRQSVSNGTSTTHSNFVGQIDELFGSVDALQYNVLVIPKGIRLNKLLENVQQPLLKRYFAFTNNEWIRFCKKMEKKSLSEKKFHLVPVPAFGSCSMIINKIQEVLKLCHIMDVPENCGNSNDFKYYNKMIVPSFSMFQTTLNVKAETLGRKAPKLLPTYYLLSAEDYAHTKEHEGIPFALYFPEKDPSLRYQLNNKKFRATIDGWICEGPFAALIHDFYHALREMAMSENVAKARFHLVKIAKEHRYDKMDSTSREVSDILVDGELIFSYPPEKDTIFTNMGTTQEKFGALFDTHTLKSNLHIELKWAFIKNMVDEEELWRREFNLGRDDLLECDQKLYDVFSGKGCLDIKILPNLIDPNFSIANFSFDIKDKGFDLAKASSKGDINMINMLLDDGVDVDTESEKWVRPLFYAVFNGNDDAVLSLLKKNASPDKPHPNSGFTPLIQACEKGFLHIVELLLQFGASKDLKVTTTGINPLGMAARNGHVEIMRMLLNEGADVNAQNGDGDTALQFTICMDHYSVEALKLLLQHPDIQIDKPNDKRETPLWFACKERNEEAAILLVEAGAYDKSLIDEAYQLGLITLAKMLEDDKSDMLEEDKSDRTFAVDFLV